MIAAEKATTSDGGRVSVARMAQLLGVSRSGYYAWADRRGAAPGASVARRAVLLGKIKAAHSASDGVNGSPRILADLRTG